MFRTAKSVLARVLKIDTLAQTESLGERAARPAPRSLIYALCEEYQRVELWTSYAAFRLDPQAHTWDRLRRQRVPWQHEQTVESLLQRLCSFNGRRTPDAATVGHALVTSSSSPSKPTRRAAH